TARWRGGGRGAWSGATERATTPPSGGASRERDGARGALDGRRGRWRRASTRAAPRTRANSGRALGSRAPWDERPSRDEPDPGARLDQTDPAPSCRRGSGAARGHTVTRAVVV